MKKTTAQFLEKRSRAALIGGFALSLVSLAGIIPAVLGKSINFTEAGKGFLITFLAGALVGIAYTFYRPIFRKLGRHLGDAITGAISTIILFLSIYYLSQFIAFDEFQPDSLGGMILFFGLLGAFGGWAWNITKMENISIKSEKYEAIHECSRHFQPLDSEIELGVSGDGHNLQPSQKEFFELVETNYFKITTSIAPLIEEEFKNWKEGFKIKDFDHEFRPVYIFLPQYDTHPVLWEIAFESDHDLNHHFTVSMEGMKAKDVLIDG